VWNDPAQSVCIRLVDEGAAGIILRDFRGGV